MRIILSVISGLGLFLYGMQLTKNGFKHSIGEKSKKIIDFITNNILISILIGTLITILVQSSSATTVMVVGLTNANIIGLPQALGLIMGANIGTTITPQVLSLNFYGCELLTLLIGVFLYILPTEHNYKHICEIFIGIGLLFIGMDFMKLSIEPLIYNSYFREFFLHLSSNPIIGILTGFLMTGLIQSSSASISLLMVFCSNGLLSISSALPIIYGGNIGTCITSLLSSIGTSKNAKRAAMLHLFFNILGTFFFMLFFNSSLEVFLAKLDPFSLTRQVANAHTIFNIINTVVLLPFASLLIKLVTKLIPITPDESFIGSNCYLDERILQVPSIALSSTIKEIITLGEKNYTILNHCINKFIKFNYIEINNQIYCDNEIKKLYFDIENYLFSLSKEKLNYDDRIIVDTLFLSLSNINFIYNYSVDIYRLSNNFNLNKSNSNIDFSNELINICEKTLFTYHNALLCLKNTDTALANYVIQTKNEILIEENYFRNLFMVYLKENHLPIEIGFLYLSLLSNLEKISLHSANIAEQVIRFR
ncbi:MAG: Na/Pi cotransporter family protein [Peptostreptococcaceae bacterium]